MKAQDKNKSARVFFALWPNDAERAALAAWQPALHKLCGGRSMRADTLHATLLFLGDVVLHRLEALQLAAQEVEWISFDLAFDVAHYWGHNHIVFAAPHIVPPQLAQLVQALEQRLSKHRFHFDQRQYKPHITLLRHARWSDAPKVGNPLPTAGCTKGRQSTVLQAERGVDTAELTPPLPEMQRVLWRIRNFALVQSVPDEKGANYQVLARFVPR